MPVQRTQKQNAPPTRLLDIHTALQDFARLAQGASRAGRPQAGATAALLLERLMRLCTAQRGALVLVNAGGVTPATKSAALRERVLALVGIGEDEVPPLLAMATPGEQEQVMDDYYWYRADWPLREIQDKQPVVAVVLLGWPATAPHAHQTTTAETIAQQQEPEPRGTLQHSQDTITEEARSIVFLIEDAVKAVIANMLLAERVQELETTRQTAATPEAEPLKAELLSTMGHELRSPLTSIKGYTATLLRYEKRLRREEQRAFLEAIRDASETLSVIVDRLLEMAALETDAIQLHLSPVDMLHLAQEAIDAAHHAPSSRQRTATHPEAFTLRVRATDEQGHLTQTIPLVLGDQRRLREVVDHILENAMKFSQEGGEITVTLRPVTAPPPEAARDPHQDPSALPARPMVEITVQDHGVGIAGDHLGRIFERFHRVDTRLTREVNGLGLGLAICKYIVALHHGYLWAESQPGEGSTFYIWLPLAPTEPMPPTEA